MAVISELVAGENPHADDAYVVKALGRLSKAHRPTDSKVPHKVGIRNEAGAIYRTVSVGKLTEMLDIDGELEELGFTNEMGNARKRQGFDAIFSQRPDRIHP